MQGDQLLIGKETAKQLGMGTHMYTTELLLAVRTSLAPTLQSRGAALPSGKQESGTSAAVLPWVTRHAGQSNHRYCNRASVSAGLPSVLHHCFRPVWMAGSAERVACAVRWGHADQGGQGARPAARDGAREGRG